MARDTVKWFNDAKGFGFITRDNFRSRVLAIYLVCSAAALSLAVALPRTALAEPSDSVDQLRPWFAQARAGLYAPRQGQAYEQSGFDLELTVGRLLSPRFALEVGVGSAFSSVPGRLLYTDPPGTTNWTGSSTLTITPITLGARGFFPVGPATFSLLGGLGVYYTDSHVTYDTASATGPDADRVRPHGSTKAFSPGVHVGAEAALRLSSRFSLGIDVRYFAVSAKLSPVARPPKVNLAVPDGEESSGRIDGLRSTLALTYAL